jgi:hypothetical protein
MNSLVVYTFISKNSAYYAEKLHQRCEELKSSRYNIIYKCIRTINNPQYKETERIPEGWEHIADVEAHQLSSSFSHSLCIKRAVQDVEKGLQRFILFCDADICVLYQDWDKEVINRLIRNDLFGWESKFGFPAVFFFAFNKDILNKVSFDFTPRLYPGLERTKRIIVRNQRLCKIYNKKIGDSIKCDTGWRIPEHIYKGSLKYACANRVLSSSEKAKLPFKDIDQKNFCLSKKDHMAEWHLDNQLFGTHLQASRSHGIDSEWGKAWMERISMYLKGAGLNNVVNNKTN